MHMKRTADRLFGTNYKWSVLGAGRNQMPIAAMAAAMGGNVRVGLEDSLWDRPGQARREQRPAGAMARQIIEGLGLEVATADEAREIVIHAQRSGCFELVAQRSLPSVIWVTTAIRSAWRNGLVRRGRVVGMPSVSA
jgi:hypothetical protein